MEKLIYPLLCFALMVGCQNSENQQTKENEITLSDHQWTEVELNEFSIQCNTVAKYFAGDKAEEYCDCVIELITSDVPDPDVAHEMADHEWIALLENSTCHEKFDIPMIENKWTDEVTKSFLTGCIESAIDRYEDAETAKEFCNCSLEKTKELIPNPNFAIMLTEEEYRQILSSCNSLNSEM